MTRGIRTRRERNPLGAELARALVALLALALWCLVIAAAAWTEPPGPVACECETDSECERRCLP